LFYFYAAHFDPVAFDEIHSLGIPTINFYCNSIYQFELVSPIAAKAAFSWHAERNAKASYLKVGANPVWVQMGADPNLYHPAETWQRIPRACFIGQRYADREFLLAYLVDQGVPVSIYGSGWGEAAETSAPCPSMDGGRPTDYAREIRQNFLQCGAAGAILRTIRQVRHRAKRRGAMALCATVARGRAHDIADTMAQYEVALNFSNVWSDGRSGSALIPHVRLRDFEAPMCRTCYLTGSTDEIGEFYEIGREIDTYADTEELADKTRFYLANRAAAERLRAAGYRRARRDHTWQRRFEDLFQKTGLS
jgi:hypothetical protein